MKDEYELFELYVKGKFPKKYCKIAKDNNGVVYVSSEVTNTSSSFIFPMISDAREPFFFDKKTDILYVCSKWVAKIFPKTQEFCQYIENNISLEDSKQEQSND